MTHGVIGNTSDFGSAESWFEPRWVNKNVAVCGVFVEWPAGKANWARSLSRHDEQREASSGSPGGSTQTPQFGAFLLNGLAGKQTGREVYPDMTNKERDRREAQVGQQNILNKAL